MANVVKYAPQQIPYILKHDYRAAAEISNPDLDRERSKSNYYLKNSSYRESYDAYKTRIKEVRVFNRADVKTIGSWIVTLPRDCKAEQAFFRETYKFLNERYGEKNCVAAVVHKDEKGQAHLHYAFIPVVEDKKTGGEKCCANDVLNRHDLRSFHGDLQSAIDKAGIHATVNSGITAQNGRNYTIEEIKRGEMPVRHERGHRFDRKEPQTYERGHRF